MMMLPSIMDVAALAMSAFSPSKTCKVRVSSTRYRNDPYRARVLPRSFQSVTATFSVPAFVEAIKPTVAAPLATPVIRATASLSNLATVVAAKPVAAPVVVTAATSVAPATKTAAAHFAMIGFKHEAMMFQAPFRVSVGDLVVVEADRGEHLGIVQEITTTAPKYNVPCRVLRRASPSEMAKYDALRVKETSAAKSIQKLSESLGLGIKIMDTEFQMDDNKLTVFFASKVFVDFRKLQRSLFRDYRCRIWLVNWAEVRPYTSVPMNRAF